MSEMVLARHSRRKKKSYRSHSWHEGAKPYFTVFSTSKHIVAEMHEAFVHLVDIFIGEALHGKNVNNSKFIFFCLFICIFLRLKSNFISYYTFLLHVIWYRLYPTHIRYSTCYIL